MMVMFVIIVGMIGGGSIKGGEQLLLLLHEMQSSKQLWHVFRFLFLFFVFVYVVIFVFGAKLEKGRQALSRFLSGTFERFSTIGEESDVAHYSRLERTRMFLVV